MEIIPFWSSMAHSRVRAGGEQSWGGYGLLVQHNLISGVALNCVRVVRSFLRVGAVNCGQWV